MSPPKAQWTILIYIAAHNNLEHLGQRSLSQILGVGSTPQLNLTVLYDGPRTAARYRAGEQGLAAFEEPLANFDSGDPDALLHTARWAYMQCPAERYGLILWSHGSGWRPEEIERVAKQARGDSAVDTGESVQRAAAPGSMALFRSTLQTILKVDKPAERAICFDDGTGRSLDTLELERIAREIQIVIGKPLDLLGMDACLMASLEVAYQLRRSVSYLVASEELVPGFSWPYDTILGELCTAPERSARELAISIVQHYSEFYTVNPPAVGDVTKVALDLSKAGELARSIDCLADTLIADMDNQADELWKAQLSTFEHESRQKKRENTKFRYHLWDAASLAARLANGAVNHAVREAAREVVTSFKAGGAILAEAHHGAWFDGIGGVSIYLVPPRKQRISPFYEDLAFAKETRWHEMLKGWADENHVAKVASISSHFCSGVLSDEKIFLLA
jgi:hypothetical protein